MVEVEGEDVLGLRGWLDWAGLAGWLCASRVTQVLVLRMLRFLDLSFLTQLCFDSTFSRLASSREREREYLRVLWCSRPFLVLGFRSLPSLSLSRPSHGFSGRYQRSFPLQNPPTTFLFDRTKGGFQVPSFFFHFRALYLLDLFRLNRYITSIRFHGQRSRLLPSLLPLHNILLRLNRTAAGIGS